MGITERFGEVSASPGPGAIREAGTGEMGANAGRRGASGTGCVALVEVPWIWNMRKGKYQQCFLEFGFSNWMDNGGVIY